jgi:hypothetical protein
VARRSDPRRNWGVLVGVTPVRAVLRDMNGTLVDAEHLL